MRAVYSSELKTHLRVLGVSPQQLIKQRATVLSTSASAPPYPGGAPDNTSKCDARPCCGSRGHPYFKVQDDSLLINIDRPPSNMPPKAIVQYVAPKTFKEKSIKVDAPIYADGLRNTFSTTRDVSKELHSEVTPFVMHAKQRVRELIDIIQQLRKEIKEARDALALANKDDLHPILLELGDDPREWGKGEELKMAT